MQVQTVRLWMTTMSIQGKKRIATIFSSGSRSELDEVNTTGSPGKTENGNGDGDLLGGGDGAGGDLQLEDGLRARF